MRAREVAISDLEGMMDEDWVDPFRRPCILNGVAYVPVRVPYPCDCEIAERKQYRGRGFFMLGDVAVVHGKALSEHEIRAIIELRKPRGIVRIRSLNDPTRIPDTEVLYGTVGELAHRENGYTYILDPQKVMFSQGNAHEKLRMAGLAGSGAGEERVADMFAGIGYFTIPMAGTGAFVHAVEINPVAFGYLEKNIAINRLQGRVAASLGDCRHMLEGIYDRIVMGHFDAISMLACALAHVREGSVIHLHSLGPVEDMIEAQLAGAGFSAQIHVHKVKKYRPHTWHLVQDIVIT